MGAEYTIEDAFVANYLDIGSEYIFSDELWNKYSFPGKHALYGRRFLYGILKANNRSRAM